MKLPGQISAACLLALVVLAVLHLATRDEPAHLQPVGVGIATDWTSAHGQHRVWTVSAAPASERFVDDHVAAFVLAQEVLTPVEEK